MLIAPVVLNFQHPCIAKIKNLAAYPLPEVGSHIYPSAAHFKNVLESVVVNSEEKRLDKLSGQFNDKHSQDLNGKGFGN